ncbi:energy transducer TonB family protein [Pseudomonas aeruginosa]
MGGHRAVAGACPRQRRPERDPGAESSGREALDQAAVKAVKRWSFVPAKRGDKAEDGWVQCTDRFQVELNLQRHEEHPS